METTPATTEAIVLDNGSEMTVRYEMTFGDLLVSTLLVILITVKVVSVVHSALAARRGV